MTEVEFLKAVKSAMGYISRLVNSHNMTEEEELDFLDEISHKTESICDEIEDGIRKRKEARKLRSGE